MCIYILLPTGTNGKHSCRGYQGGIFDFIRALLEAGSIKQNRFSLVAGLSRKYEVRYRFY